MDHTSGNVFAYVYPPAKNIKKIAEQAYLNFLTENALDFTVFPSVLRLEVEVVSMVLRHLNAPFGAAGSFSTGGTESIFLAVKAARDYARDVKNIVEPEMVVPITAHSAFHKAAHLLCVKIITVPVNSETRKVEASAMKAKMTR